jgi:glycosyltransferase involved in cell wall biosynthesis
MDRTRHSGTPALSLDAVRVVRVIARLNIGGPSIQAITLTKGLEPFGYRTALVRGREGEREGSMDDLADELGVEPVLVSSLRRDPGWHDLRALISLVGIMWRKRPQIVHTHAAKAGTLGRLAALATAQRRGRSAVIVHTFHGHSLTGYFSAPTAAAYRWIERVLARRTAALIAVSEEVRDELVALGVAPAERFEVIPLGFDLSRFSSLPETRATARFAVREQLGIPPDAVVITLIARLVPIKRVDRFLTAATMLLDHEGAHFLVVGDGELRESLQRSSAAETLGSRITWAGFRRDIPEVCFASDIVVLCSDNEGTPVSLIEAAAAGLPTVSTRVGGAAKVVLDGESGILVERDSGRGLADAVTSLVADEAMREQMGSAARAHALATFSLDRLLQDLDALYQRLLVTRCATGAG